MKKKICKNCRRFVLEETCPACGSNQFANSFQGRLNIIDPAKSEIGKKVGIEKEGEYAIRIR